MTTKILLQAEVPEELSGSRLDLIAARLFPDYSRARLQSWIKEGALLVNKRQLKAREKLKVGDQLVVNAELQPAEEWQAQAMELAIIFEDEHLLVIDKAAGVVVHPAAGNRDGTLLNGLLYHCPQLEELPRAGIVHRLDKDTTGLLVVAKTLQAHTALTTQLQQRTVTREYEAFVNGVMTGGGIVTEPLGRHPVNRKKRAVIAHGQEAITHYRVITRFRSHSHIQVKLETGRTHQIRVHMAHIGYSLIGDSVYGGRLQIPRGSSAQLIDQLHSFKRQALHARRLSLSHPVSKQQYTWEAARPADMQLLLQVLQDDC